MNIREEDLLIGIAVCWILILILGMIGGVFCW